MPVASLPTPGRRSRLFRAATACSVAAWLVCVAIGFGKLLDHASTPGAAPTPPQRWPAGAPCPLDRDHATLLMFVHPGCPCTLASLAELERIVAQCNGRVATTVQILDDHAHELDAAASPAWAVAARIPGARTQIDRGGAAARMFCVTTSGSVVLYAPDGRLLFHGGITGSRGHEGDNPGADAVVARIHDPSAAAAATAVFGCRISEPDLPAGSPPR